MTPTDARTVPPAGAPAVGSAPGAPEPAAPPPSPAPMGEGGAQTGPRGGRRVLQPCGTPAAYQRHYRAGLRGDQIDPECRSAYNAKVMASHRKVRAEGRDLPPCSCCGSPRVPCRGAHGWCAWCLKRWVRAGRPEDGPPPSKRAEAAMQRSEFAFLRAGGETVEDAARRVGIASATGRKWESLRKRGALVRESAP